MIKKTLYFGNPEILSYEHKQEIPPFERDSVYHQTTFSFVNTLHIMLYISE